MTKIEDVTPLVNKLNRLWENAQESKILWEEMKILSASAFDLQDQIMMMLDKLEKTEKDLIKLQSVFDTRELVWDLMAKIGQKELDAKEKATKNNPNAHEKTPSKRNCGCTCHSGAHEQDHHDCTKESDHHKGTCQCHEKKASKCGCDQKDKADSHEHAPACCCHKH